MGNFIRFFGLLCTCLLALVASAQPIRNWQGDVNGLWSTPGNWAEGVAPSGGEQLRFPPGVTRRVMTNNIANLTVHSVAFMNGATDGYILRGNTISILGNNIVAGGVQASHDTGLVLVQCNLIFLTNQIFSPFLFISSPTAEMELQGAITLNGGFLDVRSEGLIDLRGPISGVGNVAYRGPGRTSLGGISGNTYTGTTFVRSGTLELSRAGIAIPGDLEIGAGLTGPKIVELISANQISDTATVRLDQEGLALTSVAELRLNGLTETIGSLSFRGGQVIGGGGTLTLNGDVEVLTEGAVARITADLALSAGNHNFIVTNNTVEPDLEIDGIISGPGDITKSGPGTMAFIGASDNTYSGATTVRSGILQLGKTSNFSVQGSRLEIGDASDGSGGDIVRLINNSEIRVNTDIIVNRTGILDFNGFTDDIGDVNLRAGRIQTGSGLVQLRGNVTASGEPVGFTFVAASIAGNLDLGASTRTFDVANSTFLGGGSIDLIVDAVVSGAGGITKTGDGDMQLTAPNTFTGTATVNAGILHVTDDLALGTTNAPTVVNNSASLMLRDVHVIGEPLTLNSTASNPGALFGDGQTNRWTGHITLSQTARIGSDTGCGLNLGGGISGTGDVEKEDDGLLVYSGSTPNTYDGVTFVRSGRLFSDIVTLNTGIPSDLIIGDGVGGADADSVVFSLHQINNLSRVTVASSGFLALGADTIGSLEGNGHVEVFATGSLITGGNNASTTFSGLISGGGTLTKRGTGTFTLEANNTYTGLTTVETGTLLVNGQQSGSPVTVGPSGTLGGNGAVAGLSVATGGDLRPGTSPGRLSSLGTALNNDSVLNIELDGLTPGTEHDQLNVTGTLNITGSQLAATLGFAPAEGDQFIIVNNDAADPVVGTFDGLPNGGTLALNNLQFRINYNGGSGNDVTLTAQNFPMRVTRTIVSSGNLNGVIDVNECNLLQVVLTNLSGAAVSGVSAQLVPVTPGVLVTAGTSAYPNLPAATTRTNSTFFQVSTLPEFVCGINVEFDLTVTSTEFGQFLIRVVLPSGGPGSSVLFSSAEPVGISDNSTVFSDLTVSGVTTPINKVVVSLFLTHGNDADLDLFLVAPDGTRVELSTDNGGAGNNYGSACNTPASFDDGAATAITAAAAPFVGTFRPEGQLADFRGMPPAIANGTWRLEIADDTAGNSGALNCWSLRVFGSVCQQGGGPCESCPNRTIAGTISAISPQQSTLLRPDRRPSVCGDEKTCPGVVNLGTPVRFVRHSFVNGPDTACINVTLNPRNCPLFTAAFLGNYDPALPCANHLADAGGVIPAGSSGSYSFKLAPHATFVIVVLSTNPPSPNCIYTLSVSGGSCQPLLGFSTEGSSGGTGGLSGVLAGEKLVLDWSTAAIGWQLEYVEQLPAHSGAWIPVPAEPVVVDGKLTVTLGMDGRNRFFRLRKP
jgi:autotransporter-associated beta strand protein